MSTDETYNPFTPPQPEAKNAAHYEDSALPAVLNITREPLTDFERKCFRFSVERSLVEKSNVSKRTIAEHLESTIQAPWAIFADLKRENFKNAFAYSGKGLNNELLGYVIIVFLNLDERLNEWIVFDWETRVECPTQRGLPVGWQDDLGDIKWQR